MTSNRPRVTCALIASLIAAVPLVPFQYLHLAALGYAAVFCRFLPAMLGGFLTVAASRGAVQSNISRTLQALVLISLGSSLAGSLGEGYWRESCMRTVYYAMTGELLFLAVVRARLSLESLRWILNVHLCTAIVVSLLGIGEIVLGLDWYRETVFTTDNPLVKGIGNTAPGRAVASIGNPVPLGAYLALSLPPLLHRMLVSPSMRARLFFGLLVGIMTLGLYLSYSRSAWIAAAAAAFYLARRRKVLILVIGCVCILFVLGSLDERSLGNRHFLARYVEEFGDNPRVIAYSTATDIWSARPLLGVGSGAFRHYTGPEYETPDNWYLLVLSEQGLLGLALHIGIISVMCKSLLGVKPTRSGTQAATEEECKARDEVFAVACGLGGFLLGCFAWDGLRFPVTRLVFWVLAGVAMSLSFRCEEHPAAVRRISGGGFQS